MTTQRTLDFTVAEELATVVIKFSESIIYFGMTPQQAVSLAEVLITRARVVARRQGVPLVVTSGVGGVGP
jgi:hypothetical protein